MDELLVGIVNLSWKHVAMWVVAGILIYLAIRHDYEPLLLLPIGFGAILTNIPFSSAVGHEGFLTRLLEFGIYSELFPVLIFIAIGAMCDFSPLIRRPIAMLFGAAAQFGIFATIVIAAMLTPAAAAAVVSPTRWTSLTRCARPLGVIEAFL